jgi:hypothetical protein
MDTLPWIILAIFVLMFPKLFLSILVACAAFLFGAIGV